MLLSYVFNNKFTGCFELSAFFVKLDRVEGSFGLMINKEENSITGLSEKVNLQSKFRIKPGDVIYAVNKTITSSGQESLDMIESCNTSMELCLLRKGNTIIQYS